MRSPGVPAIGNEVSSELDGCRLPREHTWLHSDFGYPTERSTLGMSCIWVQKKGGPVLRALA